MFKKEEKRREINIEKDSTKNTMYRTIICKQSRRNESVFVVGSFFLGVHKCGALYVESESVVSVWGRRLCIISRFFWRLSDKPMWSYTIRWGNMVTVALQLWCIIDSRNILIWENVWCAKIEWFQVWLLNFRIKFEVLRTGDILCINELSVVLWFQHI